MAKVGELSGLLVPVWDSGCVLGAAAGGFVVDDGSVLSKVEERRRF